MGRLRLLIGLSAVLATCSAATASAVTYETAPSFCTGSVAYDYLAPLKGLPKLRAPSPNGLAGAGHSNLLLKTSPRLTVGDERVEYWFALRNAKRPVRLGWSVTATLARLDEDGRAIERVARSKRRIGTVTASNFPGGRVSVAEEPDSYRLLLAIRNSQGKVIAQYGSYHRAEPLRYEARLVLNAAGYRPEQTVFARVENLGTGTVSFGAAYAVQKLEGSRWVKASESPSRFIKPLYILGAGTFGGCLKFWIPTAMAPGRYRITKGITLSRSPSPTSKGAFLAAEFEIAPTS